MILKYYYSYQSQDESCIHSSGSLRSISGPMKPVKRLNFFPLGHEGTLTSSVHFLFRVYTLKPQGCFPLSRHAV